MGMNARAAIEAPEWSMVSTDDPCPVCGSSTECSILEDDAFIRCMNTVCDWPVLAGGWIHRAEQGFRKDVVLI